MAQPADPVQSWIPARDLFPLGKEIGQEEEMQVSDVMTRNVMSIRAGTSVADAIRILLAHGFSGVPVVTETGVLAGILTEGDLLRRFELGTEKPRAGWLQFLAARAARPPTTSRRIAAAWTI